MITHRSVRQLPFEYTGHAAKGRTPPPPASTVLVDPYEPLFTGQMPSLPMTPSTIRMTKSSTLDNLWCKSSGCTSTEKSVAT